MHFQSYLKRVVVMFADGKYKSNHIVVTSGNANIRKKVLQGIF